MLLYIGGFSQYLAKECVISTNHDGEIELAHCPPKQLDDIWAGSMYIKPIGEVRWGNNSPIKKSRPILAAKEDDATNRLLAETKPSTLGYLEPGFTRFTFLGSFAKRLR